MTNPDAGGAEAPFVAASPAWASKRFSAAPLEPDSHSRPPAAATFDARPGKIVRQLVVFVVVGLASALLDVGTLAGLMRLGANYKIATTVAFFVALIFNYFSHARVTFKSESSLGSMFRYGTLVLLNYGLTMSMVGASIYWLDSVMIGKIASLTVVAFIGFLGNRYWVFR